MLSKQFERWLALRSHVQMRVTKNLARVSVIGFSMVKDIAMTKEVILCCRGANIQVRHLFAADSHVFVVIDQAYVELVRSLHKHFFLVRSLALSMEQMDRHYVSLLNKRAHTYIKFCLLSIHDKLGFCAI